MSFQGFAREEQFSTNQINIDISSVINNDLAEASRMSKFMAKNQSMQERWGTMYLNALINKHAAEKENRRRNFDFFMENRKAIQEQVARNDKIRVQNAATEAERTPAPLSETIVPILFDFAVKAGSKVIQNAMAKKKQEAAEAKANEDKQVASVIGGMAAEMSPEQDAIRKESFNDAYFDLSAKQQAEVRAHFNSLGKFQATEANVAYIHKANGLDKVDWQTNYYSPEITAKNYASHVDALTVNIGGRDWNYADVIENGNQATLDAFHAEARRTYENSVAPETGLLPSVREGMRDAYRTVESAPGRRFRQIQYARAVQDNDSQLATGLSAAIARGGDAAGVEWLNSTRGPNAVWGHQIGYERTLKLLKSGAYSSNFIGHLMKEGKIFGPPGAEKLKPGTDKWAELEEIRRNQVQYEQQGFQSASTEKLNTFRGLLNDLQGLNQQQSQVLLGEANKEGSRTWQILQEMSSVPGGKNLAKQYYTALQQKSGYQPMPEVINPDWETMSKVYNDAAIKSIAKRASTEALIQGGFPSDKLPEDQSAAQNYTRLWLESRIGELRERGITSERDIQLAIGAMLEDDLNTHTKELYRMIMPKVTKSGKSAEDGGGIPQPPEYYPRLQKALADGVKGSDGRQEYARLRKSVPIGGYLDRSKIWQDGVIRGQMEPFLDILKLAKESGGDVQDTIARFAPAVLRDIAGSWNNGHITQAINSAISEGNFPKSYSLLTGDDLFDAGEVEQFKREQGRAFMNLPDSAQTVVSQQPTRQFAPYAAKYQGIGIADYKQRPVEFTPEAGRDFETMNAAYITETGDQTGLGPGISSSLRRPEDTARLKASGNPNVAPHDQSNHPKGKAFDINWYSPQGVWIRNNAQRFGFKYNNYNSQSTHFDHIGGN